MTSPFLLQQTFNYVGELLNQLPAQLYFHNREHTLNVFLMSTEIARYSNLPGEDLLCLQIAALFHDTGYIYEYNGHEDKSKLIAAGFLLQEDGNEEMVEKVLAAIEATKMPQRPKNAIEEILCDADLSHLAHPDYLRYSDLLRKEWEAKQLLKEPAATWIQDCVQFLQEHQYFTPYGKARLEPLKQQNIRRLSS